MAMKIYFATGNAGKFKEVKKVMESFGIEIEQINIDKPELKCDDIEVIAKDAAKRLANELGKPIMVDDTGLFFNAYKNFPGAHPKFVFNSLGYEGILKLLKGADRKAHFMSIAAYCEPDKEAICFQGKLEGEISEGVSEKKSEGFPFNSIFVPRGYDKCLAELDEPPETHRQKAFSELARWIKGKRKV